MNLHVHVPLTMCEWNENDSSISLLHNVSINLYTYIMFTTQVMSVAAFSMFSRCLGQGDAISTNFTMHRCLKASPVYHCTM